MISIIQAVSSEDNTLLSSPSPSSSTSPTSSDSQQSSTTSSNSVATTPAHSSLPTLTASASSPTSTQPSSSSASSSSSSSSASSSSSSAASPSSSSASGSASSSAAPSSSSSSATPPNVPPPAVGAAAAAASTAVADSGFSLFLLGEIKSALRFFVEQNKTFVDAAWDGNSALTAAIQIGNTELVRFLIAELHASLSHSPRFDGTLPIHFACATGSVPLVQLLLDMGGTLQCATALGTTPLMYMCIAEQREHAPPRPADASSSPSDTTTPLPSTAGTGDEDDEKLVPKRPNLELLQLILRRAPESAAQADASGMAPLHVLTARGYVDLVKLLLQCPDVVPDNRALRLASGSGHAELVRLFLSSGANPADSTQGWNALQAAVHGDHVDVVRVLLEDGRVHPNAVGSGRFAPGQTAFSLVNESSKRGQECARLMREFLAKDEKKKGGNPLEKYRVTSTFPPARK